MKDTLTKAIETEMALKMVEALPQEQKERLIADAVARKLDDLRINYEVGKVLEAEAMRFVCEYAQTPEVQEKLRAKAREVVDDVIDGIQRGLGKEFEDFIRSNYRRVLTGPKYDKK